LRQQAGGEIAGETVIPAAFLRVSNREWLGRRSIRPVDLHD